MGIMEPLLHFLTMDEEEGKEKEVREEEGRR
jgi:hypothetical protein